MTAIEELLDTWIEAERTGDAPGMAALLTDDFVGIGPLGFQLPKPAWVGRLADGQLHYDELSLDEVSIREYPESALAAARWKARGIARGHPVPTTRVSVSLVRLRGAWKIAGIHYSFIAGEPGAPGLPGQEAGRG